MESKPSRRIHSICVAKRRVRGERRSYPLGQSGVSGIELSNRKSSINRQPNLRLKYFTSLANRYAKQLLELRTTGSFWLFLRFAPCFLVVFLVDSVFLYL
ncbi:hypothetical protein Salmi_Mp052 (mitochondrion) [Salvia miltiorrhiza]|uniref:Uncharacterized protein n=1 Tax=Salvia miltiorrhiza TaxID=226208 RepID=V9P4Y2_SALMI|nr:hypothetical protein Salmi_Mp052 [Salvia miltiorrhiza]AGU16581.1 hypothetical protein Salmi_Mp052 [Salvia miltiorrhiza]